MTTKINIIVEKSRKDNDNLWTNLKRSLLNWNSNELDENRAKRKYMWKNLGENRCGRKDIEKYILNNEEIIANIND